jgi:hypothetical protein
MSLGACCIKGVSVRLSPSLPSSTVAHARMVARGNSHWIYQVDRRSPHLSVQSLMTDGPQTLVLTDDGSTDVTLPSGEYNKKQALLFLPDVFGLELENSKVSPLPPPRTIPVPHL